MPERLYVSDLDGTLLNRQAQLSTHTRATLETLLAKGMAFTVATARHVVSIQKILGDLPLRLPVIGSNGAFISDLKTGRHEMVQSMPREVAEEVFAAIVRHGHSPFISVVGPQGDRLHYSHTQNAGQQAFVDERIASRDPRLTHSPRMQEVLRHPTTTMVVVGEQAALEALQADIATRCGAHVQAHVNVDLYAPDWPWLTVHDRSATKDQAIVRLAQHCGLQSHQVVVFGDHANDMTMLRAAHRAVAPANAIDAVLAIAHEKIGPHDEDSVADYLARDWGMATA